jgi:DNA repair exonuclease SbcCD ATPase subunit
MKLSELKKYIEENIVEILDEGAATQAALAAGASNPSAAAKTAKDAAAKDPTGTSTIVGPKGSKVIDKATPLEEKKEEDEEVEDTYGKEDEDDKKDAKIKAAKPTKDELKKNASISTITDALAKVTKEFKEVTEKYKKAEGGEKAKFLAKLKDLTPKIQTLKKALEKKEEALK